MKNKKKGLIGQVKIVENAALDPDEGYIVSKTANGFQAQRIYFDETAYWPSYKWWRNPIKWYKWRKMMKKLTRKTFDAQWTPPSPNPFWKKSDLEK